MSKKDNEAYLEIQAKQITQELAELHNVTDPKITMLIQIGVTAGLKAEPLVCTCLSDLEDDAYELGGPMSRQQRPPPCKVHSNKR